MFSISHFFLYLHVKSNHEVMWVENTLNNTQHFGLSCLKLREDFIKALSMFWDSGCMDNAFPYFDVGFWLGAIRRRLSHPNVFAKIYIIQKKKQGRSIIICLATIPSIPLDLFAMSINMTGYIFVQFQSYFNKPFEIYKRIHRKSEQCFYLRYI